MSLEILSYFDDASFPIRSGNASYRSPFASKLHGVEGKRLPEVKVWDIYEFR